MDAVAAAQRREIGSFLRQCRLHADAAFVAPAQGRRRHVTHLTQAELAELAGVSEALIAQVETGRYEHLTPRLLAKLGSALRLDGEQMSYLRHLLTWTDVRLESAQPGPLAAAQVLVESITSHPALLVGQRFEILAWNRCAAVTLTDFAMLPPEERNVARLMFGGDGFCRNWLSWEDRARTTVAGLRIRRSELPPGDEAIETLIAQLRACDARFAALWDDGDLDVRPHADHDFQHPSVGLLRFQLTVTAVLDLPDVTISHLLARDAETGAKLRQLAVIPLTGDGTSRAGPGGAS